MQFNSTTLNHILGWICFMENGMQERKENLAMLSFSWIEKITKKSPGETIPGRGALDPRSVGRFACSHNPYEPTEALHRHFSVIFSSPCISWTSARSTRVTKDEKFFWWLKRSEIFFFFHICRYEFHTKKNLFIQSVWRQRSWQQLDFLCICIHIFFFSRSLMRMCWP